MKSLILNEDGLRADDRPAHEILRREPLRTIPIGDGLHMVIHAREAGTADESNVTASLMLWAAGARVKVAGDAVIVRPGGELDATDTASLAFRMIDVRGAAK